MGGIRALRIGRARARARERERGSESFWAKSVAAAIVADVHSHFVRAQKPACTRLTDRADAVAAPSVQSTIIAILDAAVGEAPRE